MGQYRAITALETGVRPTAALVAALALAAVTAGCGSSLSPSEPLQSKTLDLTGTDSATLPVTLPAGEYIFIRVEGRGIDVVLEVRDATRTLARLNAPGRATGEERLLLEPAPERALSLVVTGHDYATVHGEVRVEALRLPDETRADHARLSALRLETAATAARESITPEAAREAARQFSQAAELHLDSGDPAAAARARLDEAWTLGWHAWDYAGAADNAEAALSLARKADLPALQAHALMCAGAAETSVAQSLGRADLKRVNAAFAAARRALDQAAELYERADLPALEALAVSYRGVADHYAGRWDEAERNYRRASDLWLSIDDGAHHTLALQSLALLMHERGDPRQAIEYFDQALAWKDAIPAVDYAYLLYNSALPHQVLGQFDSAIERYYGAMQILAANGEIPGAARALQGVGTVLEAAGETERAREALRSALAMSPAGSDSRARLYALLSLGQVERKLGNVKTAVKLDREALSLAGPANDEIRARVGLAIDLIESHQLDAARTQLHAALDLPLPESHRFRGRAWRELGRVEAGLGNTPAAATAFDNALRLSAANGTDLDRAYVLETRARTAFEAGDIASVADDSAAALAILTDIAALGVHAEERAVFLASQRKTLEMRVEALLAMADTARREGHDTLAQSLERQAFEASDRSRSVALIDALRTDRPQVPDALLERRRTLLEQLAGELSRRDALLSRADTDPTVLERLARDIATTRSELDAIAAEIGDADRHGSAPSRVTEPLAPPDDTVLAEYFLGERKSWLFLLDGPALTVVSLPPRADLEALVRQIHMGWSSLSRDPRDLRATLDRLSAVLFDPVRTAGGSQDVLFVPDGPLHLLPLTTLAELSEPSFMERELRTVPSLFAISVGTRERRKAPHLLAMIADPVFDPSDPRATRLAILAAAQTPASPLGEMLTQSARSLGNLQRLPAAAVEARDILALVPDADRLALTGFDANRDNVVAARLGDYRILHFATHAWSDAKDPALAMLSLSTLDPEGHPRDGALRAGELASMRLNADLVVLSGCETALGRAVDGEGLVGLSTAFLRAGAGSVVASLWRVPDTSTAYLMREFYRNLLQGRQSPERALRNAQRKVRSQPRWADPYYWAGFQFLSVAPPRPLAPEEIQR